MIVSAKISEWAEEDAGVLPGPIAIGEPPGLFLGTPGGGLHALDAGLAVSFSSRMTASPAAGDADGDGWVEIFVPSDDDSIRCYELRTSRVSARTLWWPLARRNAARTGSYGYEPLSVVEDDPRQALPRRTGLASLYPNPFNPAVRILFDVSKRSRVEIAIYDVAGREVALVVDRHFEPGRYEIAWNGRNSQEVAASSGVYFCRFKAADVLTTKKIILIR